MRALYLTTRGTADDLELGEIPQPSPGKGEVLVRVSATAVTPTELQWTPTFSKSDGKPRPFPVILGHEFSGIIAAVGDEVTDFKVNDAVYGMNDWYSQGTQAEYCVAPATAVARKPRSLSHAQAAVVPISALTAWQGLFDRAALKEGETVLIHGGAGGVGIFAIQLAHSRGAHVIATGSEANLKFLRDLGADEVIDYKDERFEDHTQDLDVIFDSIGGDTLERSWPILKADGRLVTIASTSAESPDARARKAFFIVEPNRQQLSEIGNLIEGGKIKALVEAAFPWKQPRAAYAHAKPGGMRGKVVLQIEPED